SLRRVLDVGNAGESCIQVVPGRGYRFVLDVTQAVEAQPDRTPALAAAFHHDARLSWWTRHWRIASVVGIVALLLITIWPVRLFSTAAVPPRLSVVVLPFDNLGSDRSDSSAADGITEDLTTLVAQLTDISVIARDSAFA